MTGTLYLAWRYLAYHRVKTVILIASITLIVYVPVGLRVLVDQSSRQLTARAAATPLLIGAKGSPLELVLNSLYFATDVPAPTRYAEVTRVTDSGLAQAIPLYTRFRSRNQPIVGTSLDYFSFRGLSIAAGRQMTMLGECVVGARAGEELGVGAGDYVVSSPENVFDLAGVYPLKMRVAGVLAPSATPDDDAIFVDLKTSWIIEGLGHGHQDLSIPEAAGGVLDRDGNRITANASVVQYNEITGDNIDSFHFHGDLGEYPVTAVIAVPVDQKASALLQGRYQSADDPVHIVRSVELMDQLLGTVLTVRNFVIVGALVVGLATLATAALVFLLSLRLRGRERETLFRIGGSRTSVSVLMASEIGVVLVGGAVFAAALTLITAGLGEPLIRLLVGM